MARAAIDTQVLTRSIVAAGSTHAPHRGTLRRLREAAGLSLREVAKRAHVSATYLSRLELHGVIKAGGIRDETAYAIAKALGLGHELGDAIILASGRVPADVLRLLQRTRGALAVVRMLGVSWSAGTHPKPEAPLVDGADMRWFSL